MPRQEALQYERITIDEVRNCLTQLSRQYDEVILALQYHTLHWLGMTFPQYNMEELECQGWELGSIYVVYNDIIVKPYLEVTTAITSCLRNIDELIKRLMPFRVIICPNPHTY